MIKIFRWKRYVRNVVLMLLCCSYRLHGDTLLTKEIVPQVVSLGAKALMTYGAAAYIMPKLSGVIKILMCDGANKLAISNSSENSAMIKKASQCVNIVGQCYVVPKIIHAISTYGMGMLWKADTLAKLQLPYSIQYPVASYISQNHIAATTIKMFILLQCYRGIHGCYQLYAEENQSRVEKFSLYRKSENFVNLLFMNEFVRQQNIGCTYSFCLSAANLRLS